MATAVWQERLLLLLPPRLLLCGNGSEQLVNGNGGNTVVSALQAAALHIQSYPPSAAPPAPFPSRRPKARVVLVRFCARALLQQLFRRDFLEGASPGGTQSAGSWLAACG